MPLAPGDEVAGASYAKYQEQYPQFAWAFSDPEVAYWLDRAMREKMGPDELAGWIYQTSWWKQKSAAERDWLSTLATNPADANRQAWNYDSITKYQKLAGDYGIPVSFDSAQRQVFRVVNGTAKPDDLEEELRRQAIAMYPQLQQQFEAGATVADVYAPYKQQAADLLGVNPDSIMLTDPKWTAPLQITDKYGIKRLATVDEWQRMLRTDPKYGFAQSKQGREDGFNIGAVIGRAFGNQAS